MRRFQIALVLVGVLGAASAPAATASGWSIQHTPNPAGATASVLNGVSCASARACTAVGDYYNGTKYVTLAERWNGTTWSIQRTPNPTGRHIILSGVSCTSKSACISVGYYKKGTKYVTLAERWDGAKWSIQRTPNLNLGATNSAVDLSGVSCTSKSSCTAVGYYSDGGDRFTLAERWNGTKWSVQHTADPGVDNLLNGVSCATSMECTAVGWERFIGCGPFKCTITGALAEGWNGASWTEQSGTPASEGLGGPMFVGVSCSAAASCTAVGTDSFGNTLAAAWNGTTWETQSTPNPSGATSSQLTSVSCRAATVCTAVGEGNGTLAERWNGTQWSIQHTPTPPGAKASGLNGVFCASGRVCTAVGSYNNGTRQVTLAERWNGG